MEAAKHFLASILLACLFLIFEPFGSTPVSFIGLGVVCGTLIDLDHFIVSRMRNGDWHHLKNALNSPLAIFIDYRVSMEDFEDNFFGSIRQIYVSHFTTAILISTIIYFFNIQAALTASVFFGLHILMDIIGLGEIIYNEKH